MKNSRSSFPTLDAQCRTHADGQSINIVRNQFLLLELETVSGISLDNLEHNTINEIKFRGYKEISDKFGLSLESVRLAIRRQMRMYQKRIVGKVLIPKSVLASVNEFRKSQGLDPY